MYADIAVVAQNQAYTVDDSDVVSRCRWTPLAGTTLHNRVVRTYVNGRLVYADGRVIDDAGIHSKPLSFNH
jgi:dihydroorotase